MARAPYRRTLSPPSNPIKRRDQLIDLLHQLLPLILAYRLSHIEPQLAHPIAIYRRARDGTIQLCPIPSNRDSKISRSFG
jgi:hypothetical protein